MPTHPPLIGIPCRQDTLEGRPARFFNLQSYCQAVEQAGGLPVLLPIYRAEGLARMMVNHLDGLLLAGGGDVHPRFYGEAIGPLDAGVDPEQDILESRLIADAMERDIPVLGICRGMQILNVACGGSLVHDLPTEVGPEVPHQIKGTPRNHALHPIDLTPHTRLARILRVETLAVNSFHHQAARKIAPGFITNASAPDGVVEGIEIPDYRFVLGMQCHPEEMIDEARSYRRLFEAFVQEAAQARDERSVTGLQAESTKVQIPTH